MAVTAAWSHAACGSAKLRLFLSPPQTSELGVTEHIEGDACKFALWAGRTPSSDNKTVLKVRCEGGDVDQVGARWAPGGRQVAAVATAEQAERRSLRLLTVWHFYSFDL